MKHQVTLFQNVLEKAGVPNVLSALVQPVPRIQQSVVTMIAVFLSSDSSRQSRMIQEKDFVVNIMKLLESASPVIRGKTFLAILQIVSAQNDLLVTACQQRLVMYLERDYRRSQRSNRDPITPIEDGIISARDDHLHTGYLNTCLECLVHFLSELIPNLFCKFLIRQTNFKIR